MLPALNAALKKDATFPLSTEQLKANAAVQRLACRSIRLAAVDMVGSATGDRPLEQVADFCPYEWGGTVYQMSPGGSQLNVLGMYGGALSLPQSNWHPRRGELHAQREVCIECRKHLGRLPAICWTDHSASVKDAAWGSINGRHSHPLGW